MFKHLLTFLFISLTFSAFANEDTVSVAGFLGAANPDGVEIQWTTTTESGVEQFVLERSLDAVDFEEIAWEASEGGTETTQNYSYTDEYNYRQLVYYRLKTVMGSEVRYSDVIAVSRSSMPEQPEMNIFPTITNSIIRVIKNSDEQFNNAHIRIFDRNGHLLQSKEVAGDFINLEFDVSGLDAGMYILEVRDGKVATKAKFIKQN